MCADTRPLQQQGCAGLAAGLRRRRSKRRWGLYEDGKECAAAELEMRGPLEGSKLMWLKPFGSWLLHMNTWEAAVVTLGAQHLCWQPFYFWLADARLGCWLDPPDFDCVSSLTVTSSEFFLSLADRSEA